MSKEELEKKVREEAEKIVGFSIPLPDRDLLIKEPVNQRMIKYIASALLSRELEIAKLKAEIKCLETDPELTDFLKKKFPERA